MARNKKENFSNQLMVKVPSTRYQGSKQKIVDWIWRNIKDLEFNTFLDAFGGTGVVGYYAKVKGKQVTYNDIMAFNHWIGRSLIENNHTILTEKRCGILF